MHVDCLREDVWRRIYDRLGVDQPYIPAIETDLTRANLGIEQEFDEAPLNTVTVADERPAETSSRPAKRPWPVNPQAASHAHGVPRKKRGCRRESNAKPYFELFQANLRISEGPMVWDIKDLRPSFAGGVQTWSESVLCLLCGADMK